jgi:hypothetical protein
MDSQRLPFHVQPRDPLGEPGRPGDHVETGTEREIVSIVWHQKRHLIDIAFDVGETDQLEGPHQLAAKLAADADLSLVPTRDGTVKWIRTSPDDWWSE